MLSLLNWHCKRKTVTQLCCTGCLFSFWSETVQIVAPPGDCEKNYITSTRTKCVHFPFNVTNVTKQYQVTFYISCLFRFPSHITWWMASLVSCYLTIYIILLLCHDINVYNPRYSPVTSGKHSSHQTMTLFNCIHYTFQHMPRYHWPMITNM